MGNTIKKSLFAFFLVILLLPLLQQCRAFYKSHKLYGYFVIAPDVEWSWTNWWNGIFAKGKGAYINDHFGFRPELLLVNNQVDYSLFHKYHATWIAPGTDHYLFQTMHINAWHGKDFVGYVPVLEKLVKLKAIQDTLGHLGKSLILAYSPDKACFYPEYFSPASKTAKLAPTNFETYRRIGDSLGINQLDFNSLFMSLKSNSRDLLFTRQGIHWSVYGSLVAADSLVSAIEKLRNIHMPRPVWTEIIHTTRARDSDDDLAKTLNLIFPYVSETFSYPVFSYPQDNTMVKPRVIYIGDSFLETWIRDGFMEHTNSDWQVWNHFGVVWDKDHQIDQSEKTIADFDWIKAVQNADCIIIMYTSFNLPDLGDGFIERAYEHFYPNK